MRALAALPRAAAALVLLLASGCSTAIHPRDALAPPRPATFSHADLDRVQSRFVDAEGRVDYAALAREPGDLERYYALLAAYSPDSAPHLFPTPEAELAYWIDAYNASVLVTVLRYYPIPSVTAVPTPFPPSLVSDKIGFFYLQEVTLGGEETNLYDLENSVIRGRFREPRIHFALNCASLGCPRLPQHAFTADQLDRQLDEETRRFFAEERNLRIDHAARVVHLSSILDWYEQDFTGWYAIRHPGTTPVLLDYVALYVDPERREEMLRARAYDVEFVPYDWSLNDQARFRPAASARG